MNKKITFPRNICKMSELFFINYWKSAPSPNLSVEKYRDRHCLPNCLKGLCHEIPKVKKSNGSRVPLLSGEIHGTGRGPSNVKLLCQSVIGWTIGVVPQSRQSAKLFHQSSELGLPQPLARRRVCPPGSGGRGTLAGERGVGRVPILTRGIHFYI